MAAPNLALQLECQVVDVALFAGVLLGQTLGEGIGGLTGGKALGDVGAQQIIGICG